MWGAGRNLHDAIDRSELGLTEIRSHVWMGVIWINLSGDAPKFEDNMKELIDRWSDFDRPFHGGRRVHLRSSCSKLEIGGRKLL